MNITEGLIVGLSALRKNKMRSLLTMLGIIIGISGVVAVVSVGSGARKLILTDLQRIGQANMIAISQREWARIDGKWQRVQSDEYLEIDDAYAIKENCPSALTVTPEIWGIGVHLKYEDKDKSTQAIATVPGYQQSRNWFAAKGRFFSTDDIDSGAKVCILGHKVWEDLCNKKDKIVGDEIQINGIRFAIVGVMEEKGDSTVSRGWDDRIFLPLTAAQMRFLNNGRRVKQILVQARNFEEVDKAEKEIKRVLNWRHEDVDTSFDIWTSTKAMEDVERVSNIIKGLLGGVASIALVVGGIGIMNIMLVSVTERTWEIGLRKAVGAKRRDVLLQFLLESAVISVAGGIIGILIGVFFGMGAAWLFSTFVAKGTEWPSVVSLWSVIAASTVSLIIGVVFGIYPANRAAKLTPTEALRHK